MQTPEGASIEEAVQRTKEFQEEKKERKPWSDAAKAKLSLKIKEFYRKNPAKRQELAEKMRASWTPERRKEFSKVMKRTLASKEVREKIRKGLKEHWDMYRKWKEENERSS